MPGPPFHPVLTIRLQADGDFFNFDGKGDANNTLVFDGLRTSCQIGYGNGNVMPTARIRIYGLRLENDYHGSTFGIR